MAGKQQLAEAQYYFQINVDGVVRTAALVSLYSPRDWDLWEESHHTLWACNYQGERALKVVDVKSFRSVVAIPLLPGCPQGRHYLVEKPGLDVAHIGGRDEHLTEE